MPLPSLASSLPASALAGITAGWRWLPVDCLICGRSGRHAFNLCPDCIAALPTIAAACPGCGLTVTAQTTGILCGKCLSSPPLFDFCRGLFEYAPPVSDLITGLKFHGRLDNGLALSVLLADAVDSFYSDCNRPQLLLPVPLHRRRLRQRGFNQALEIARVVASRCRLSLATDCVERVRHTAPQTEQSSVEARRANLGRAFRVRDQRRLDNVNHITLIDDVVTSMATVSALSRCLRAQGIRRIDVWCLARASR